MPHRLMKHTRMETFPAQDLKASRKLLAFLWLIVAAYALFVALTLRSGYVDAARGDPPLYTDYTSTYGSSLMLRQGPAESLYLQRSMYEASRQAARAMYGDISDKQTRGVGFAPFMYPPTVFVVLAPLAYFPYLLSWFLWLVATALPYLAAMRRLLPAKLAWPLALAAPPAFFNIMYGQTGFLTAGLIALGLTQLACRPVSAGILIGLASFKPHLGILIPIALIAGGHWRAFAGATAAAVASIAVSLVLYGDDPWFAFIGTSMFHLQGFAAGAYNYRPMSSILATLQLAGVPLDAAYLWQAAAAVAMAILVAWSWRSGRTRPDTLGLRIAILCVATPLALPMVYLYDLALLVPAAVWVWLDIREHAARRWEQWLLFGICAGFLAVKQVATSFGIQLGAALTGGLLALALYRYLGALGRPPDIQ